MSALPQERTCALQLGAGESEIMAVTGHTTSKEVTRYTRGARQKVLAAKAMARFDENKN
jgi:hypothetical protein